VTEYLFHVDWQTLLIPKESILQMMIRGTVMYAAAVALVRVFRRQAGGVGIADILVLVFIADAASNGMTGDGFSLTEALVVITTIMFWDWTFDWLGFKSKTFRHVFEPEPLLLIKNGRILRKNLTQEMITEDELFSQLRQKGVHDIEEVIQCALEGDGEFSVITRSRENDEQQQATKKKSGKG
jgi:uncharacterized membrane protein YcaP (DUF421 family)